MSSSINDPLHGALYDHIDSLKEQLEDNRKLIERIQAYHEKQRVELQQEHKRHIEDKDHQLAEKNRQIAENDKRHAREIEDLRRQLADKEQRLVDQDFLIREIQADLEKEIAEHDSLRKFCRSKSIILPGPSTTLRNEQSNAGIPVSVPKASTSKLKVSPVEKLKKATAVFHQPANANTTSKRGDSPHISLPTPPTDLMESQEPHPSLSLRQRPMGKPDSLPVASSSSTAPKMQYGPPRNKQKVLPRILDVGPKVNI
ncbi:hypothetical protein C8Q75DRAFT_266122 [Abortiporus biennis]|nr:hypothetical protein C8Q75DRAFT_266122 [Abortiporus biennis]